MGTQVDQEKLKALAAELAKDIKSEKDLGALEIPRKTAVIKSRIFRKLHAGRFCMKKSRFSDSQRKDLQVH